MHVQTGKVSKCMETRRILKMVQVKNTATEMKDCFNGLITALDMTSERKKKQTMQEQRGNIKKHNIYIIGILERERRRNI